MQPNQLLARLDRIPVWPYSYGIVVVIGIGFFFAFFDIITIGLALPVIVKQFHISTELAIWSVTTSLAGYIIGSFLDSRLSDHYGRRLALIFSMLFFSIGSILSATSPNIYWLMFWRFIIGMGIGAEIANVTTYLSELSPAACRGRMNSIAIAVGYLGFAIVPFVGFAVIPQFEWGWRLLFALGGLGGLMVMFARRFIPETVRWQINQGKLDAAEQSLAIAESIGERRYCKPLPAPAKHNEKLALTNATLKTLFRQPYLKNLVLFAMIWLVYYIGNYGWLTLNTKLFLLKGFDLSNSLLLVSLNSLGFIVGSLMAIWIGDRFQRKYLLFYTALLWSLSLLYIALFAQTLLAILLVGCLAASLIALFIPQMYTYTTEIFPTGSRATGVSVTDGFGHLGGAFCGQIIFFVAHAFPNGNVPSIAFSMMALSGIATALLLLLGPRKTKAVLDT